jgi:hypothetical protein
MHIFAHNLDHDYYFELPREANLWARATLAIFRPRRIANCSVFYGTPSRFPGCPACEPNFFTCS